MPAAVRLREDYSAKELRRVVRRSKDVNQSRRLLSLAAVRDGMDRGWAAKIGGMDRQTLRDWVHRFNASGAEGLIDNWTAEASFIGGTTSPIRTYRRGRAGSREGWGRALAADRPQTRHRRKVWRRLPPALCRKAPEEAWLLAYQPAAASSRSGRTDHRGFQKRMARPVCKGICRD
jgi:Helix-turn-helix domain